jgi:ribosomal-protein-alanine N-acetyltransferase
MGVRVGVAPRSAWAHAARAVFSHLPDPAAGASRLVALLRSNEIDPDGLFTAKDESGDVFAATLAVALPGAQGQILPPVHENPEVEDRLVAIACRWLESRGVKVVQVNLADEEARLGEPLVRGGFQPVTRLMQYAADTDGKKTEIESGVLLTPYADSDRRAFAAALVASYTDTHDCPELDGARTAEEIVAGYRATAGIEPDWHLAVVDDEPAGVLLLSAGESAEEREIAYLGVVPEFRRRGVGGILGRAALRFAGEYGATRVIVGVDERNVPAIRLYERLGFAVLSQSVVYLKFQNP